MTLAFARRHRLLSVAVLAAMFTGIFVQLGAERASRTRGGDQIVRPVTDADPRVAGVFATLKQRGLAAALDSLEGQASHDSLVLRSGHQLAHALGRQALALANGNAEVIEECRPIFASGCYHGLVESLVAGAGRLSMAQLAELCAGAGRGALGPVYECMHGVGHGVLGALAMNVPKALDSCRALGSDRYRTSCFEGVFMEGITRALAGSSGHHHATSDGLRIDLADPYSPCRVIEDPYASSCWLFQGFIILRREGFSVSGALRVCDNAPPARVARCYEGVGHQITGLFQRDDKWVIAQCRSGAREFASHCAAGAAIALVGLDWSGQRAHRFCAEVPEQWTDECRAAITRLLG